jgi:hypothetical protein
MIDTLAARDRRALVAGMVAIGALVAVVRGVPAWWRWRADARSTAAESIAQEQRVRGVIADFSQSVDTLSARVERFRPLGRAFLPGATTAEAAASLTAIVGEIARASLVRIDAMELRIDSATSRLDMPRVRLEAQATADVTGLAALLRDLEKGPTLLAVRSLSVRPQSLESPANQAEMLTIHFTVEGLALLTPVKGEQ